jgi:hypothetical protein
MLKRKMRNGKRFKIKAMTKMKQLSLERRLLKVS